MYHLLSVREVCCLMCMVLVMQGKSTADIGKWMREHAGDAADAPEFAEFLAAQLMDHMLGQIPVSSYSHPPSAASAGMALASPPHMPCDCTSL